MKTDKVDPYGPAGAWGANRSPSPLLLGLKVPEKIVAALVRLVVAASSKVRVTWLMLLPPPQSDSKMVVCSLGPTKRASISPGKAWLRLLKVTVTLLITPVRFETRMDDG